MARWEQEKLEPSQGKLFLAVSQGKSLLAAEEEKKKDISNKLKRNNVKKPDFLQQTEEISA